MISTLFTLPLAVEFTNRASLSLALLGIPDTAPTYDSLTLVGLSAQHQCHALNMTRLLQIDVRFSRSFAGIYQSVFLPRNTPIFTLGMDRIADGLMADGILTGAGKVKWHTSTINKILRNEKYMGDALLQKTYTTDFLTKKRIKNNGTVPQYYVEGDHEAIIPKELFMQVQAELVRRRVVHVSPTGKKRRFSCNHCFAQMVFCGDCGELYRRVHWNNHGCKSIVWRCISRLEITHAEMPCENRTVNELLLQEITLKAINKILTERKVFLKQLQANIAKAVVSADTLSPDGIQERLSELQKELIKKANNKQDYDAIADEIFRLREQKEQSEVDSHRREETMNRIKELQDFIAKQKTDITEFDETMVRMLIEKITVFADHFTVEFKSGLTIDIEA
ncbi:recombinase family protein [Murdochiella vaginalis]|uniref:recombinase family protein n=1 Tax=Murdochiella vaginalis TaxID=1852373 RepID=UPI000B189EA2|nr:recombinase family protein [Murdochiella vaginalis]